MPDGTLADRMAATGKAIKHQQQVAKNLAEALEELVMETERMTAQIVASDLGKKELNGEMRQMDMDLMIPDTPESAASELLPAKVPRRNVCWEDITPSPPVHVKSTFEHRVDRIEACYDSLAERKKQASKGRMFSDPDELREQIRENLTEEDHDLSYLYKDTGICQVIVQSFWFETTSMLLVFGSSVWMAVEIDYNHSSSLYESDAIFQVVAHLLCLLFSVEIMIRIGAFRHLTDAMKEFWIVFDLVLVLLLVAEVWILGTVAALASTTMSGAGFKLMIVFRVFRLIRLLRLAHVLQHLPELMVIVRGLVRAVRAISVVLVLMALTIYLSAMVFKVVFDGSTLGGELFPTVRTSMGTLMLDCTLSGSRGTAIMRAAWDVHPICGMLVLLFVLVSNVTFFGVLTGLLVQTVKTVAELEREEKAVRQLVATLGELWNLMIENDNNGDGKIDFSEFTGLVAEKQTAKVLRALDLDMEGLASVAAFVFEQNQGQLGRKEFLQMVLDVRNSKKATVKDHIETRKFTQAALLRIFKVAFDKGKWKVAHRAASAN